MADIDNPFAVQTPEDISADDAHSLFVNVFTDFYNIREVGNTFLHGPRGSGKSMMFRYLEPDCQMLETGSSLSELPFYGAYVPVKNTDLKLTEFRRLEDKHANIILNEHFLTSFVGVKVFSSLQKRAHLGDRQDSDIAADLVQLYNGPLLELLNAAGSRKRLQRLSNTTTAAEALVAFVRMFNGLHSSVIGYLKRLSFNRKIVSYTGPLCGFLDFLLPLLKQLRCLPFMPSGPIYLLIDDADNLNYDQTTILNSWVFCRTSSAVSLKISTQLSYKTFRTVTGPTIDAPHDYSEVNISAVYTSSRKDTYLRRVSAITQRRLQRKRLECSPEGFFPPDHEQEQAISDLADKLRHDWPTAGRGYRAADDAYRYARPIYMTELAGSRKAGSTYSYAGFSQLVHLSSGIIRHFLDAASKMYAEMRSIDSSDEIHSIAPHIQDRVVRDQSEDFITREFDKLTDDDVISLDELDRTKRLRNLIYALGGTFREILHSNASERRVFSIALSDAPDDEVRAVLMLGVRYGYFHLSTIGNKEGTGRTSLYILTRLLAPFFSLDPTGFAGYKFVTSDALKQAMARPKTFLGRVKSKGFENIFESPQLALFEGEDDAKN